METFLAQKANLKLGKADSCSCCVDTDYSHSDGYAHDFRLAALQAYFNNVNGNSVILTLLRNQQLWPSRRTLNRWRLRFLLLGHIRRFRRTGNRRATVLRGTQLINLALWRALWPRGTHHEANVWLHHANGRVRFYQPSQISKAEDSLGLSIKRASTTARQAMLPINRQLRYNYWYLPCPFGIANVPRSRIIDLDEAALFLESSNRGRGKAHITRCVSVRDVGPYGHSKKLNILVAICGEDYTPGHPSRRWISTWNDGGTTIARFLAFVDRILQDIGPGTPADWYCITMGNLSSHRNIIVQQMIHAAGHHCVFRAPYYPVDSPIEHVFNTVQVAFTSKMYEMDEPRHVRETFLATMRSITNFAPYFEHIGIT